MTGLRLASDEDIIAWGESLGPNAWRTFVASVFRRIRVGHGPIPCDIDELILEDPERWASIRKEVSRRRRNKHRRDKAEREAAKRNARRVYMRDYMRNYRSRT